MKTNSNNNQKTNVITIVKVTCSSIVALASAISAIVMCRRHRNKTNEEAQKHKNKMEELKVQHEYRMEEKAFSKSKFQPTVAESIEEEIDVPNTSMNVAVYGNNGAVAKPLVGDLIHCGDRCFIFSPTNVGKSILAMQLGIEIASGKPSKIVPNDIAHEPQNVLIYDAEQDYGDLGKRYGKFNFRFPEKLERSEKTQFATPQKLIADISKFTQTVQVDSTIIIDNITALCPAMQGEAARQFYYQLKGLQIREQQRGVNVTIIIIGHAVKGTSPYQPLEMKHMEGSCNMSNFATAGFALGEIDKDHRYIKLLKTRKRQKDDNVLVEHFVEHPYLHFEFDELRAEVDTLPIKPKAKKPQTDVPQTPKVDRRVKINDKQKSEIYEMLDSNPNIRISDIATRFGVSPKQIYAIIKQRAA